MKIYSQEGNMTLFRNPVNGYIHHVNNVAVFLGCFFFGGLFFLCIGEFSHFLIYFVLGLLMVAVSPLLGLFMFIYPFFAPRIVRQKWIKKGFQPINEFGNPVGGEVYQGQITGRQDDDDSKS
jgi:hypothetical protein